MYINIVTMNRYPQNGLTDIMPYLFVFLSVIQDLRDKKKRPVDVKSK